MSHGVIVIGASAGGLPVISSLWESIAGRIDWPVLLVQHLGIGGDYFLAKHLSKLNRFTADSAIISQNGTTLTPGKLYIAPVNYHLLVEDKTSLCLSIEPPEHYCRPAIDPLFMSAARVYGPRVIGIVLTGANADGASGCARIELEGGHVLVQNPSSAEISTMPQAALDACSKAFVGEIEELVIEIFRRTS